MKRISLSVEALSDGKGEFGEDHREPAAGLGIEAEFVVSATQGSGRSQCPLQTEAAYDASSRRAADLPVERRRHNPPAALDYQLVCSLVDPNLVAAVWMLATVER